MHQWIVNSQLFWTSPKKYNLLSRNTQFPVNFLLPPSTHQGTKENFNSSYQHDHHSGREKVLNEHFCGYWEFYQLRIKDNQTHISTLLSFSPNSQIYSPITINTPINQNYVYFCSRNCQLFLLPRWQDPSFVLEPS